MYNEESLVFKPGIDPTKMPEADKFKLSKEDILHIVDVQQRVFYKPEVKEPPKVEYRPGVRKFTEAEFARIFESMRKATTTRRSPECEFNDFIERNAESRINSILDKDLITKGRRLPLVAMGIEKDIISEIYFKDINEFSSYINASFDENHVSEENIDGTVMYHYMYPIGYYTDIDGGYGDPHCNYKTFCANTEVDEKHKIINILNPEEVAIKWAGSFTPYDIGYMYDANGDVVRWAGDDTNPNFCTAIKTDKNAWMTTTFLSVVFKCGFTIFANRYEYAYASPCEDVHSYMRATFIVNPK